MVLTLDKRVAVVIIDKDMYVEKCMTLLNDEEVYCECRDQTKSLIPKWLNNFSIYKNSIGPKFNDQYIKLQPPVDNSPPARFYSLLKFHKANITFRPIVTACSTYYYKISQIPNQNSSIVL